MAFGRPRAEGALLIEPAGGMRQHSVDLACVRRQIIAHDRRAAITARDIVEQPLELVDILLDSLPELGIAAVFAANLVECLLALGRIQATGEQAALAALVPLP